jgi:hypothetical protein
MRRRARAVTARWRERLFGYSGRVGASARLQRSTARPSFAPRQGLAHQPPQQRPPARHLCCSLPLADLGQQLLKPAELRFQAALQSGGFTTNGAMRTSK